ncbi:MAG: hypothetical protein AAGG50_11160 [Bacteroidota bacterium]
MFHPPYLAALFATLGVCAVISRDIPTALLAGALAARFLAQYRTQQDQ